MAAWLSNPDGLLSGTDESPDTLQTRIWNGSSWGTSETVTTSLSGILDYSLSYHDADTAALVLMLVAPFALTLGMGFVTGRFSGAASSGVSDIPVVVVDQDQGQLGVGLLDLLQSEDLAPLVSVTVEGDPATARQAVDEDRAAASILIPPGFSQSITSAEGGTVPGEVAQITLYTNPARPTSVGVIKTIVDGFLGQVEVVRAGTQVAVTQLLSHGLMAPQDAGRAGAEIVCRRDADLF